jgi:hypothetical protein
MRRTLTSLVALGLSMGLALTVTPTSVSAADAPAASQSASQAASQSATATKPGRTTDRVRATQALERAQALFSTKAAPGRTGGGKATAQGQDASLVMRDLFASLDDLSPDQRAIAHGILARPTDGPKDPYLDGYQVPSVKKCKSHFCVHWVNSTDDAPPSKGWAKRMLKLMNKVWKKEVGKLGYRPPVSDRGRGGSKKFDVYLAEISNRGLYGYCTPERRKPGFQWLASGYCVLDNDFVGFPRSPIQSAEVTAAHEFFHAIQFGYDFGEDPWLLEATATWMEERIFDDVNDNRQYLPSSQAADPATPLDFFSSLGGSQQYGNWVFFEYLSKRFGNGVVKQIWNKAAAFPGAPDLYSTQAIAATLKPKKGFKRVYSEFASANLLPAKFYPEGKSWGLPPTYAGPVTLSRSNRRTGKLWSALLHMSSASWMLKSSSSLANKKWYLKVKIDGPSAFRGPAAYVLVQKRKGFDKRFVKLNGKGNGQVIVPFSRKKVKAVYVSLVNGSTRFKCGKKTQFSCQGQPIDDGRNFVGKKYKFTATVIKRKG